MPKLFQYINYIDYNELIHKPIINGVILEGKLSLEDLGIQPAGSYAHLVNGKVPLEELPDDVFGQLQYQGIWNAELNEPLLPNIPEVKGQYWIVANGGTRFGQDWEKGDWIIAGDSVWQKIDNSDIVTSVNGMIGDIKLDASNIPYDTTKTIKEAIDQEHQDFSGDIAQLRDDLTAEVSRATSAEDDLDDKIDDEITNRTQADTTLQTSITTETTRATTAEGVLDTRITHEIQDRTNADNAFQSALENVIDGLNTEISARVKEVQDRKDADNVLQTNITAEETRAKGVEHTLQDNIDAEVSRATTVEETLQSAINSEVTARQTADTTLQENITAEVTRATGVEGQLRTDLTAETTRATTAEEELENKKADKSDTYTKSEIDGKLSGGMHFKGTVPTYDELPNNPEVGDMYNVLDTGANYAWNGTMWDKLSENIDLSDYATITYVDGKLSDEATARQTADTTLQTNITAEVTRATGVEGQLRTDLTAETTRATTVEKTLQDNIDAEILDRQSADTALQTSIKTLNTKVDGEIQDRKDADTTLTTNLNKEIQDRQSADTTLTTNLNKEIQDRKDADRSLQESITQEISDRAHGDELLSTNLANEVTRATTAEGTLTTNLANEVTRATNAETALQTSITSIDSRIDDLEDGIATDISTAINQVKADLTTEVSRATTAEGTLQSNITAEETRAKLAEKDLQTNLTIETNRAASAENTLSNSIQVLNDRIQNSITTAIQELQNDLNQEIQDRVDGDNSIKTNLDTFKTTIYTKDEVDAKMSSLFEYKGCVHTVDELPTTRNKIGDVYNVEDTGANYAWNGQTWDKLSEDINLSGLLTKEEAEEIFASKNNLEALDDKYVLKSGDTMTGSLTINGSMAGALNTNATITAGNNETVYEASLKTIRKCENDSNRVNESKTYVLSSGETIISHNRGQEDSYIMFDATKLKYGTGEQNGSKVSQVYDIMTSKDTFTKEEVQELLAQFLIDLNMSQYVTKEELNNNTRTFVYTQAHATNTWVINHNLNNYPSVVIVDDNGNQLTGAVWYADKNNIKITFSQPFAGRAYLN